MFRPVFIFKVLILSLVANAVFILYLLLHNAGEQPSIDKASNYYKNNDYYSFYTNIAVSTSIKIIPMPMSVSI